MIERAARRQIICWNPSLRGVLLPARRRMMMTPTLPQWLSFCETAG